MSLGQDSKSLDQDFKTLNQEIKPVTNHMELWRQNRRLYSSISTSAKWENFKSTQVRINDIARKINAQSSETLQEVLTTLPSVVVIPLKGTKVQIDRLTS